VFTKLARSQQQRFDLLSKLSQIGVCESLGTTLRGTSLNLLDPADLIKEARTQFTHFLKTFRTNSRLFIHPDDSYAEQWANLTNHAYIGRISLCLGEKFFHSSHSLYNAFINAMHALSHLLDATEAFEYEGFGVQIK
jgi:hypothetical protein